MALPVIADAGSPLVLVGMFHLAFGNFFIGIFEAGVVALIFKAKRPRLFIWVIVANYISCFAGAIFFYFCTQWIVHLIGGPLPVYRVNRILLFLVAITFVITVVMEWPFYYLALGAKQIGWSKALLANLIGNLASYWLLAGFYFGIASTPSGWGFVLCSADQIPPNPQARVFFISADGTNVMQWRVGGRAPSRFISLPYSAAEGGLGIDAASAAGQWRLMAKTSLEDKSPAKAITEITARRAATRPIYSDNTPADDRSWYGGDVIADLRYTDSPRWRVTLTPGSITQLEIMDTTTGRFRIIELLEIPGLAWTPSHPSVLPHNQLIFEFGGQIMVADLDRSLVAAIAPGYSPVVVLDRSADESTK